MSKVKSTKKSEKEPKADKKVIEVAAPRMLTDAEAAGRLAALRASMEKEYGKGIIQNLGAQISNQRFPYQTPTGSIALDLALAPIMRRVNGTWQTGLTPGRILEVFGPEGGGKTTLLAHICANAQADGGLCAFADAEHRVNPDYFRTLGVNFDRLEFAQPKSGTETMNIVSKWVASKLFKFVFIDSVAALITDQELAGEIGDATMGAHGRLMSQSLRHINSEVGTNGNFTNVVFVNQLRSKIGTYGNPETTTGGNALKFYSSVRIDLRPVGDKLKDGENIYGQRVRAHIIKNSIAPPFRKCEFDLVYGHGIDIHADLFDLCVGRGIITGDTWFKHGDVTLGQGRRMCIQRIKQDPALGYRLYDQLLIAVQDERGYTPDGTPIPGRIQEVALPTNAQVFVPTEESPDDAAIEEVVQP